MLEKRVARSQENVQRIIEFQVGPQGATDAPGGSRGKTRPGHRRLIARMGTRERASAMARGDSQMVWDRMRRQHEGVVDPRHPDTVHVAICLVYVFI